MTESQGSNRARNSDGGSTRRPRNRPRPALPHPLSMTWRDGVFIHWPVDPDAIRSQVPDPLEIDTYDGQAWLSVLPFVLARAGLRGTPSLTRLSFAELNVRTYVRYRGDRGLFFFSIDVDSTLVATAVNRLTRLPCHRAMMHVGGDDEQVSFSSARGPSSDQPARFSATYRPTGEQYHAEPDSLAYWLTARHRLYASSGRGVLTAEIAHAPWPLRPADVTITENTMLEANGLPAPTDDPVTHYCGELEMTGSVVRRLRRSRRAGRSRR